MTGREFQNFSQLRKYVERVTDIWNRYAEVGPGRVDPKLYEGIPELADAVTGQLSSDATELRNAVETVRDLAHRCACRSEGLCFITGEAGLIPRKDLHDAMENALATLHQERPH